jgi:hypothetical protein
MRAAASEASMRGGLWVGIRELLKPVFVAADHDEVMAVGGQSSGECLADRDVAPVMSVSVLMKGFLQRRPSGCVTASRFTVVGAWVCWWVQSVCGSGALLPV